MKIYLNLLPLSYRRKQIALLRLRQWIGLWAVALAVTGLLGWTQWSTYRAGRIRLSSLRQEYKPVKATSDKVTEIQGIIDDLQTRERLVLELADEQSMFTLMGLLSRAARACDGRVSIQDLSVQRQEQGERVVKVLTLSGLALDNRAVASFADELRRFKAFERVTLGNTATSVRNEIEARTYSMECVF